MISQRLSITSSSGRPPPKRGSWPLLGIDVRRLGDIFSYSWAARQLTSVDDAGEESALSGGRAADGPSI